MNAIINVENNCDREHSEYPMLGYTLFAKIFYIENKNDQNKKYDAYVYLMKAIKVPVRTTDVSILFLKCRLLRMKYEKNVFIKFQMYTDQNQIAVLFFIE